MSQKKYRVKHQLNISKGKINQRQDSINKFQIQNVQQPQLQQKNVEEQCQVHIPIWKKIVVGIGGVLLGFNIGILYLWGIVVVYVSSYYRLLGQKISLQTAGIILPIMFFGMALTAPFGIKLMQKFGTRITVLINECIIAASIFISSYMVNFGTFVIFFGIIAGFFQGTIYIIALAHNYKFHKKNKSIVSGIFAASLGFGTLIFSEINTAIVNPNNITLRESQKYFTTTFQQIQVTLKIMVFFRYLALIMLCFAIIGAICCLDPPAVVSPELAKNNNLKKKKFFDQQEMKKIHLRNLEQKNKQQINFTYEYNKEYATKQQMETISFPQQCINIKMALSSKIFYILFIMLMLGCNMGIFISGNYKNYGHYFIENQNYLSRIGSVGSIANGIARFLWGIIMYKFSFRLLYTIILFFMIILAITFQFVAHIDGLFFAYVLLIYCMYASHYTLFPTICMKIFGINTGAQIYSILFMAFALSNFIQFMFGKVQNFNQVIIQPLANQLGFQIVFYIQAGFTVINLLILWLLFSYKYDWKKSNYEYYCKVGHHKYIEQLKHLYNMN